MNQRGGPVAAVLATAAVLGAVWSVIPLGVWWSGINPAYVVGAWDTWMWGGAITLGLLAVVIVLSNGRAPVWLLVAWRRSLGRLSTPAFLAFASVVLVAGAALILIFLFAGNPRSVDGFAELFHARMFLAGHLWVKPPAELANFATLQMVLGPDRWFSQYPPGQPAVLAVGLALGHWWLLQPVFAVALVVGTHRVAQWVADETTARLSVVLLVLCPFVVTVGATEMSHVPAAALAVGAAAAATMTAGRRWRIWAVVAGAALGATVAFRPLDAVAASLPAGVIAIWSGRRRLETLALMGVGGVIATLPTLWFNAQTTGSWHEFGYNYLWGPGIDLGFHQVPWGVPLTLRRAIGLTGFDLHEINMYLLDLPIPVTLLIAAAFLLGRRRVRQRDAVPFIAVASLLGLLFFYFHRDTFYGPRLLFSIVPWLIILVARGATLVRHTGPATRAGVPRGMVAVTGLCLALMVGLSTIAPDRLAAYHASSPMLNYHPERAASGLTNAVVLVPDGWGTRLIARMWAQGVPVRASTRLYAEIDACTLEQELDAAADAHLDAASLVAALDSLAAQGRPGLRLNRTEDPGLRLPSPGTLVPVCEAEIAFDQRGFLAFAPYLFLNNASLDGPVVWARDLRNHNGPLRRRYADRMFYRYGPLEPGGRPQLQPLPDAAPAAGR